jgi:hypothetical protein
MFAEALMAYFNLNHNLNCLHILCTTLSFLTMRVLACGYDEQP